MVVVAVVMGGHYRRTGDQLADCVVAMVRDVERATMRAAGGSANQQDRSGAHSKLCIVMGLRREIGVT